MFAAHLAALRRSLVSIAQVALTFLTWAKCANMQERLGLHPHTWLDTELLQDLRQGRLKSRRAPVQKICLTKERVPIFAQNLPSGG